MTNQTTRRNVITGAAALPLLPAAALAAPISAGANATDAAWLAYEVAKANYETHVVATAMSISLSGQLSPRARLPKSQICRISGLAFAHLAMVFRSSSETFIREI